MEVLGVTKTSRDTAIVKLSERYRSIFPVPSLIELNSIFPEHLMGMYRHAKQENKFSLSQTHPNFAADMQEINAQLDADQAEAEQIYLRTKEEARQRHAAAAKQKIESILPKTSDHFEPKIIKFVPADDSENKYGSVEIDYNTILFDARPTATEEEEEREI